jgi:hypothetical protein
MTGFNRDRRNLKLNYQTGWSSALSRIAGRLMSWVCNCESHLQICSPSNIQ